MYAFLILLATVPGSHDDNAVHARVALLPESCQAQATKESRDWGPLHGLIFSNVAPLCAQHPRPPSGDYLLRYTSSTTPQSRSFVDLIAHNGRLKLVVTDTFLPAEGRRLSTTMSAGAFRRALDQAGLAKLWEVAHECPADEDFSFHGAFWATWEFYDHSGYYVGEVPSPQLCVSSEYENASREVRELLKDLIEKSKLVATFIPEVPKEE